MIHRPLFAKFFEKGIDFLHSDNYNLFYRVQKVGDTMSPRTGRPKAENPLNVDLKIRFDQETNARLIRYCEKHGIPRTEAIRRGLHMLLENEK